MLSTQKKKREEDMYTKLERFKMKADFPGGEWGYLIHILHNGGGGDAFHTKKNRKRGYVHKIKKARKGRIFPGVILSGGWRYHIFPKLVPECRGFAFLALRF